MVPLSPPPPASRSLIYSRYAFCIMRKKCIMCVTTGKRVNERERKGNAKIMFSQISDSENKIKELPRKYCGRK